MSTLEELSDLLDAIFRQRVSLVAAEAFIDYWNTSYSRMPVPKQGWPSAIQHCLSSVGLLPQEVESILEPTFVATAPVPHTPPATSFTLSVLTPEAFTMIRSPPRPQKVFGPFSIIPSSPVSPLLRRSSDLSRRRMPLSSIQSCESPSKRRRLAVDHHDGSDEKENVVVSVDRIAGMSPGETKKRKREAVEDEVEEQKSSSPAKKLKSAMRPRTRSALKKASQHASPASSVASNESEGERRWVEATLTHKIPFPVTAAQEDTCGEFSTPVLPRRVNNLAYVLISSRRRPKEREHTTSLDGSSVENPSSSSTTMDLKKLIRRSASIPESMLSKTEKKRKHRESDTGEDSLDLYDLVGSDPLPALHLSLPPPPLRQLRRAYSLPSSDSDVSSTSRSSSSDDDPYIGQVTPHHLISPTLQRRVNKSETRKMPQFGDSMRMPGSDDSVTTSESEQESPTKRVLLRQMSLKSRMNDGLVRILK